MKELFAQFLREKEYLTGASPKTIKYLQWVFNRWQAIIGEFPTKQNSKEFVIRLSQAKLSSYTVNSYIRGMNTFLTWMHENEHCELIRIKQIKESKRGLKIYKQEELKKILAFRPQSFADHRLYTMICFAIDTGCRIDEILSLDKSNLDFTSLLATVNGKGDKERVVPISLECRKVLYKFLAKHNLDIVFPSRDGNRLDYKTVSDQLKRVFKHTGIVMGWHKFRHSFASSYVRDGGNVFYLQRVLGHANLETTKVYIADQTEDLSLIHRKTSLLSRLK